MDDEPKLRHTATMSVNNHVWATYHFCGCYTESLGQGKRFYPCAPHEVEFDALLERKV